MKTNFFLIMLFFTSFQLFAQDSKNVQSDERLSRLVDKNMELENIIKQQNTQIKTLQKDSIAKANEIEKLNKQSDKKALEFRIDTLTKNSAALSEQIKELEKKLQEKEKDLTVAQGNNERILNRLSNMENQYNHLMTQPFSQIDIDSLNEFSKNVIVLSEILNDPKLNEERKNIEELNRQMTLIRDANQCLRQPYDKTRCEAINLELNEINNPFDILSDTLVQVKRKITDYPRFWDIYQSILVNLRDIDKRYEDTNKDGNFNSFQNEEIVESITNYLSYGDLRSIPYLNDKLDKILNDKKVDVRKPVDKIIEEN